MDLIYKTVKSMDKPSEVEFCDGVVYLRKDITSEVINYGDVTATKWTYKEACLAPEEFNIYSHQLVLTGQVNGDDNLMIIMEAIADLYEAIAKR